MSAPCTCGLTQGGACAAIGHWPGNVKAVSAPASTQDLVNTHTGLCFFIGCGKQQCFGKDTQRKPQLEAWLGPRQKSGKALLLPQQKGNHGWEGGICDRQNTDCNLEGNRDARSGFSYLKDNIIQRLNSGRLCGVCVCFNAFQRNTPFSPDSGFLVMEYNWMPPCREITF